MGKRNYFCHTFRLRETGRRGTKRERNKFIEDIKKVRRRDFQIGSFRFFEFF